jgi:hypothetical protein
MTTKPDPLAITRDLSSEFEEILGVNNLASAIDDLNGSLTEYTNLDKGDVGDLASLASLLVTLVSFIIQVRVGNTAQDQSEEAIRERLINQLIKETTLPAKVRERLIDKLIDMMTK